MTMKNYYLTISIYYKNFGGPAPGGIKSTSALKLIFSIPAIESGIFCRLDQDLPRSSFKTPSEVQWLRCMPSINAHIPMYAENNDFLDRPAP